MRVSKKAIKSLVKSVFNASPSVAIDWLESFCYEKRENEAESVLPMPTEETRGFDMGNSIYLDAKPYGSPFYAAVFDVWHEGEQVAVLQAHPRKTGGPWKPGGASLKLLNHMTYRDDWYDVFQAVCEGLRLEVNNVTRLDIALDFDTTKGADICRLLNLYLKQPPDISRRVLHLKGKAKLNSRDVDKATLQFRQFFIGSPASGKQISCYDKQEELKTSRKEYIPRFWAENGINPYGQVYRLELRLKSEGVASLKDFQVDLLNMQEYLASVVRTSFENFFEFSIPDRYDSNERRWEEVELFNWQRMNAILLPKTKAPLVNDVYKVQLNVHKAVKFTIIGTYGEEAALAALQTAAHDIALYELEEYARNRLPTWIKKYGPLCRCRDKALADTTKEDRARELEKRVDLIEGILLTRYWKTESVPESLEVAA